MTKKTSRRRAPKLLPYGKQSVNAADVKAVLRVLRSDFLTQGPAVAEFEAALAEFTGARYAVTFCNGTAALHAACAVAGMGAGDEGITSPISFAASANCMRYVGALAKFADVNPQSALIDPEKIAGAISKNTKVVIPVDFAGRPCDLVEIFKRTQKRKITIIQDAAHSFGAEYRAYGKWHRVGDGRHAHMTCFSFHPVKTFTTGEGGAVTTNDKNLYETLARFRHHGIVKTPPFRNREFESSGWYHEMIDLGYNFRLTDLQCALGLSQLKRVGDFVSRRAEIAAHYRWDLRHAVEFLSGDDADHRSAHHLFPILVAPKQRERVFAGLRAQGIGVQLHYLPIYRHPYYAKHYPGAPQKFPHAENYFSRAISLPIYPDLKETDRKRVSRILLKLLAKG